VRANGVVLGVVALLAVTASACSSSSPKAGSSPTTNTPASGRAGSPTPVLNQRINITNFAFTPARLTIRTNTTVIWYQQGPAEHTVTSGTDDATTGTTKPDGKFSSGTLKVGSTFSKTFSQPGAYNYYCSIHPKQMSALIVVE